MQHQNDRGDAKRHRKAFTLIELLVVISIISIMAAILFPVFARAREQARKAACQSNLKQLGLAVAMYLQDYDGMYPWTNDASNPGGRYWFDKFDPYVKNQQVWVCPTVGEKRLNSTDRRTTYGVNAFGSDFSCVNGDTTPQSHCGGFGYSPGNPLTPNGSVVNEAFIQNPSVKIYAGDPPSRADTTYFGRWFVGYSTDTWIPTLHGGQVGPFLDESGSAPTDFSGGGNYLFADGHVKWLPANLFVGASVSKTTNRRHHFDLKYD